jgi:succinate dehydrogenase/fumarate reductase flavoprotein subunit
MVLRDRPADVDVLVIGAGACGLAAAVAAHDAGVGVAVIEKLDRPGGNSSLSTGSVPAAGTRFQRDAGIADSPERFIDDLMRTGGPTDCPHLVRRLVETSAATVEWLADGVGARIALVTAYKHVGHSVPRLHAPVSRRGRDLVDDLLAAVEQRGIPLAVGNAAIALITDASGGAIGADIDANGEQHRVVARKTVLAVNGFAANRESRASARRSAAHRISAPVAAPAKPCCGAKRSAPRSATSAPTRAMRRSPTRTAACCRGPRSRRAASSSTARAAVSATKAPATRAIRRT